MEPISATTAVIAAGAWFGNKLLGPTVDIVGTDLKQLYEKGKDKIVANAIKKTKDIESKGQTNLRVTRDVFWNGSFTDESICAEYFGGILASSRSLDGKDDSGVFYVDIIKSMSSGQLKVHYIIYRTFNKLFIENPSVKNLNPGQVSKLSDKQLYTPTFHITNQINSEDLGAILHGLDAKNLISNWQTDNHKLEENKVLPYLKVTPTPLGIQLFAIANNMFSDWRNFSTVDFGNFENIKLPEFYAESLAKLLEKSGLKKSEVADPHASA